MAIAEDLFNTMIAALVLDSVGLALRAWARVKVLGSFGYDDIVMLISFISYIFFCAFTFTALGYGYGVRTQESYHDEQEAIHYFAVCQLTYFITSGLVKTGVALVLFRININKIIRNILIASMVIVAAISLALLFILSFQCIPLSVLWNAGTGPCIPYTIIPKASYAFSVVDIISNWFYSLIPIVMLWKVKLSPGVKISVMVLLGIGMISSIATIVRFTYITTLTTRHNSLDNIGALEINLTVVLWCHIELFLAILASSLAALRPLFRQAAGVLSHGRSPPGSGWKEVQEPRELSDLPAGVNFSKTRFPKAHLEQVDDDLGSQEGIINDRTGFAELDR
ncbi:hypothetical protein AAE478_002497 [Parahypoxylon ruwenzoriense]